jgi:class 3 adenylate cyclase
MAVDRACEIEATILLADVVGSTRIYETLGNEAANRTISRSLNQVAGQVAAHEGVVVKIIGDAILAYFRSPDAAVGCALTVMARSAVEEVKLSLCCHHGAILVQDGDIFGDAVNVTALIAKKARTGELLTTGPTVERLGRSLPVGIEPLDEVWLKTRSAPINLYLITPRELLGEVTSLQSSAGAIFQTVTVTCNGRSVVVGGEGRPTLVLGRAAECDLVFHDPLVSRRHASIEAKGRHVYLRDHSRNGTFLKMGEAATLPLLREEHRLAGSGTIALGGAADGRAATTVAFRCRV